MDPIDFGNELDAKFEAYKKMTLDEQGRDASIERSNLEGLEKTLKASVGRCGNPDCNLPLAEDNYRVLGFGDVCHLCYDMYHAVHDRAWFVEAHRKWYDAEGNRKRQVDDKKKDDDPYGY